MKSRIRKQRRTSVAGRLRSSLLSAASATGFALLLFCNDNTSVQAQQPLKDAIFEPANRVARFLGIGYSDGYHASQSRSNCALLDLPPASLYRSQAVQQGHAHNHALYSMPASAYTFGTPAWTGSGSHHHAYTSMPYTNTYQQAYPSQPNTSEHASPVPAASSVLSYPVQPAAPPNATPPAPASANPKSPSYDPSLSAPAPNTLQRPSSPRTLPSEPRTQQAPRSPKQIEIEDLPAPPAASAPTSPSDRPNDPPSSKFFEEEQTQSLLEGLESLGEQTLEDPLMQDQQSPTSSLAEDDESLLLESGLESGLESMLPESSSEGPAAESLEEGMENLDLDFEGLSLPPASGDADNLLNTQLRINPYHPNSPSHYTPASPNMWQQQAQNPRLTAPIQQSQKPPRTNSRASTGAVATTTEQIKPAVTRVPLSTATHAPRTARTIYEPRR